MLIMSAFGAPLALFDFLYVPSYWQPITLFNVPIGIEGFFFSFIIGGLAAVSYAEIEHKKLAKISKYNKHFSLIVLFIVLPLIFLFRFLYHANISIAMYIALLVGVGLTVFLRKDLLKSSILGSIIFGTIYTIVLIIWSNLFPETKSWFTFQYLPKIFILNAPIYEIIFGFIFGAYWGNLYELLFGYRFK